MKEIVAYLKRIPIFDQAKNNRFSMNLLLIIIVFFMLWGGGFIGGRLIAIPISKLISRDTLIGESLSETLRRLLVCGIQISIFFLWIKYGEKRSLKTIGFQRENVIKLYLRGAFIGLCFTTFITIIRKRWNKHRRENKPLI